MSQAEAYMQGRARPRSHSCGSVGGSDERVWRGEWSLGHPQMLGWQEDRQAERLIDETLSKNGKQRIQSRVLWRPKHKEAGLNSRRESQEQTDHRQGLVTTVNDWTNWLKLFNDWPRMRLWCEVGSSTQVVINLMMKLSSKLLPWTMTNSLLHDN